MGWAKKKKKKKTANSPPVKVMNVGESRIVTASWGPLNKHIYAGHENGDVSVWDWQVLLTHTYTCKKKQKKK